MLKKAGAIFLLLLFGIQSVEAAMSDYAPAFNIDLEQDRLPTNEELDKYFYQENTLYDTHYKSVWDLGNVFDRQFYTAIATYGTNEKRLKWEEEDMVLQIINALPKKMYPYIGPMLFKIPSMSEKVLNLPGIKETKNQFPKRIAPQLKDIEDLEFLSPELYFLLMPEVWPENNQNIEHPQIRRAHPKVVYDKKFYQAIRKIVNPERFMGNVEQKKLVGRSDLRTINPTKDSLLTSTDVQAFVRTIDEIQAWGERDGNALKVAQTSIKWLTMEHESSDPYKVPVPGLKDMVNPCSRLVQKATILGQERELALITSKEGFTLNEWAYTCDKTFKAYRLANITPSLAAAIRGYQRGSENEMTDKLSPQLQAIRYSTMQAIIEMYKAPLNDVVEVRKNQKEIHDKLLKYNFELVGTPIARID